MRRPQTLHGATSLMSSKTSLPLIVKICAYAQACGAVQRPKRAKVLCLVNKLKVFGQAFFKRLAGCGAAPHKGTACALQGVNSETVLWTVSGEGRLCKREPPLVVAQRSLSAFHYGTPCRMWSFNCAQVQTFKKAIAHASARREICGAIQLGKSLSCRDFPLEKQSTGLFFNSPFSERLPYGAFAVCGRRRGFHPSTLTSLLKKAWPKTFSFWQELKVLCTVWRWTAPQAARQRNFNYNYCTTNIRTL